MGKRIRHVVHVIHSLQVGGTENGLVNVVNALMDEFHHTVIAITAGGPLEARLSRGVDVIALGKQPGVDVRAIIRLAGLLRRLRPDIVHSRNWGAFDAIYAARLARVPVVIHGEHGREASDPEGLDPRRNRLRRWTSPLVDRFVTVSRDLEGWLVRRVGVPAHKVVTIHNGVDLRRFADEDRAMGRRELDLPPETVVIGTVGRLDPVKDQIGLLDASAMLPSTGPRYVLALIGEGPCRAALEARAARPDLARRVRMLGERSDVPRLLAGLDVFTLPSIAEGISNTVLEAMSTGLPVVATRTGGNPELVEDGVTGRLVPVADRRALADALWGYVGDAHLRALHGKAGRQRAVDEFSLDRMTGRYRELYRTLVAQKAA
jgi:sugar transferase (PEP-CTERM/EpsH1 system associated)